MSNLTGLAFRSNPFLATRKEVEEWLKGQPDKTATSFRCGEEKLLLVWRSGEIEVIDATRIPRSAFIGTSLDDEQVAALAARIDGTPVVDDGVKNLDINIGIPGGIVQGVNVSDSRSSTPSFFCLTQKGQGQFFDLVIFTVAEDGTFLGMVTYSQKDSYRARHTGDVTSIGGVLYHAVSIEPRDHVFYVVGVVGYHRTPLVQYSTQCPAVTVATGTHLTVCPLSLAPVVCGQATLALLGAATLHEGVFTYGSLNRQFNVPNINTGMRTPELELALRNAVQEVKGMFQPATASFPAATASVTAPEWMCCGEPRAKFCGECGTKRQVLCCGKPITRFCEECGAKAGQPLLTTPSSPIPSTFTLIAEHGIDVAAIYALVQPFVDGYVRFSDGIDTFTNPDDFLKMVPASTILPVFSEVAGPPAGNVRAPTFNGIATTMKPDYGFVVLTLSENWNESSARCATGWFNKALVVFKAGAGEPTAILRSLNRLGACLAGPCCNIVVDIGGRFYWYRGIRWPGMTHLPLFAEDVTDMLPDLFTKCAIPMPSISPKSNDVWYGSVMSPSDALAFIQVLSAADIIGDKANIIDLLTQLSIVLDPKELPLITRQLTEALVKKIDEGALSMNEEIASLTTALLDGDMSAKASIGRLVHDIREFKRSFSDITARIENLSSQQACSSISADLKKVQRVQVIAANVARVAAMTSDDIMAFIESIPSWAIFTIEPEALEPLKRLDDFDKATSPVLLLDSRLHQLDGETVAFIVGQPTRHLLTGGKMAIARSHVDQRNSSIPVPLLEEFEVKHPFTPPQWMELANSIKVSSYRIQLRSMFCGAERLRCLGISPASRDLTYYLIWLFLGAAENMSQGETAMLEWADTKAVTIRSLVCHAMTMMASGTQPASNAFTFFSPTPTLSEPWIIIPLVKALPYTGWDCVRHIRTYMVTFLNKKMLPLTEPLRKSIAALKAASLLSKVDERNNELQYACLAVIKPFFLTPHDLTLFS